MIKQFAPKTLFGRGLLIVVLPTILVQLITAYIFFERHWDSVTRYMSSSLAGEIAFTAHMYGRASMHDRETLEQLYNGSLQIEMTFTPGKTLDGITSSKEFPFFQRALGNQLALPFALKRDEHEDVDLYVQTNKGLMKFDISAKRLESPTTRIFMLWMSGATFVFLMIAILFLRNQVRPIKKLAEAAEAFGKGRDVPDFKPSGALEVRRASRAFLVMRERLRRQVRNRTEMLAGISHDLRTPLTRLKLGLSLLKGEDVKELQEDVSQMEHMIQEYLQFARGEGMEDVVIMESAELMRDVVEDYVRIQKEVHFTSQESTEIPIRPLAFRRLLSNIIDNALRYGKRSDISTRVVLNKWLEVVVDDDGPGIPADKRDDVFRPFTRLDPARNMSEGGAGLGLTIARDLAQNLGGDILLADSPLGGLRVIIRLPL